MTFPHIPEDKQNPHHYQKAEQMWAQADDALNKVLEYIKSLEPKIYGMAPGNSDVSILFDFLKGYIMQAEIQGEQVGLGSVTHDATIIMAASAITRLIRQDDRMRVDNLLAQLEKENDQ